MTSYSSSNVIQYLRQYEMFANSLKLIKTISEREMVIKQLTKLEEKIISESNKSYEEEYNELVNKECGLLNDEKKRLVMLVDLINQRLSYVEKRCNDHYQLTGEVLDIKNVSGSNTLDDLENKIKIIDKYSKNVKLKSELEKDIESLNSKILLASEKIDINSNLNKELESKLKNIFEEAFKKVNVYQLLDIKEEIEYAYYETEKSLTLAELNLESSKTNMGDIYEECLKMYNEVSKDYYLYKEKISFIKLMEIYGKETNEYSELLNKRKEINDIIKYIKNEEFNSLIGNEVNTQYNTIIKEQQDINTLNDLLDEKNRKNETLKEINEENNSEEFQNYLNVIISNEKKIQERLEEEQRLKEEELKRQKQEEEKRKQEEILKRQKVIEEARKKEIEKRTKMLLEQQQNSVLQVKNKEYGFDKLKENIKDQEEIPSVNNIINQEIEEPIIEKDKIDDDIIYPSKHDIEEEIFAEMNQQELSENNENDTMFPNVSIGKYMEDFNEDEDNDFFGDNDIFPSIPM